MGKGHVVTPYLSNLLELIGLAESVTSNHTSQAETTTTAVIGDIALRVGDVSSDSGIFISSPTITMFSYPTVGYQRRSNHNV